MSALKKTWFWWAVLALAVVGQLYLHGAETPVRQWLLVTCEVLPILALFFIVRLGHRARLDPVRFILKFALFVAVVLLLDPFGPFGSLTLPLLHLPGIVGRVVLAGRGWLLPLVILGFFVGFALFKYSHLLRSRR